MSGLRVRPLSIKAAMKWARENHRHLKRVTGGLFAIGCEDEGGVLRGVAIVANPARLAQDGWTAEVSRVATDGTRNACSFLYGRARRAAQLLGYRRLLTKSLPSESGASFRAIGAKHEGMTRGGEWSRPSRKRAPAEQSGPKHRWSLL